MKASKKALACICALIMATTSLAAFSVNAADDSSQTAVSQSTDAQEKTTTTKAGKVTAVNGTTLTVAMGEFAAKQSDTQKSSSETSDSAKKQHTKKVKSRSNDEQTTAESKTESASDSTASQTEDSQSQANKKGSKRGRKHFGKGKHGGEFTENGTTATLELSSDVAVKKHGKTITAADISEGDIVKLKYDQNNKLVEVKVSSKHNHSNSSEKKSAKKTTDESTQADVQSSATVK